MQWKVKRSVSAPKCQFSPAGQSLIQPLLESFEHVQLKQKQLNQKAISMAPLLGLNQIFLIYSVRFKNKNYVNQ